MEQQDFSAWLEPLRELLNDPYAWCLALGGSSTLTALLLAWVLMRRRLRKVEGPSSRPSAGPVEGANGLVDTPPAPARASSPAAVRPGDVCEIAELDEGSWLTRLRQGLAKTRSALQANLEGLFTGGRKLDGATLEQLHETLFRSDIGVATADKLVEHVRVRLKDSEAQGWVEVQQALHEQSLALIGEPAAPLVYPSEGPLVILVVGVNGVGKTTTIGKLAAHFLAEQKSVLLCAADTFRAAAIDQLKVWGERLDVQVIAHQQGGDPAAVAYDGVKAAMSRCYDVLLIDTAGRLHSKSDLMAELDKINRVIAKDLPGAPHETWLVVDATTGQNAFQQVKAFKEVVQLTGLVVTKLDGTAKGGVIIGISDQFKLPVRYIGVGEKASDLRSFVPRAYVDSLFA